MEITGGGDALEGKGNDVSRLQGETPKNEVTVKEEKGEGKGEKKEKEK